MDPQAKVTRESALALFDDAFKRNAAEEMSEIFHSTEFQDARVAHTKELLRTGAYKPFCKDVQSAAFLAAYCHEVLRDAFRINRARVNALERRIEELERQPFAYDGPHEPGKTYRKGTFVTHGGSVWHCNYTTTSKPGDGPAWTLAVKRGKDAQ